MRAHLVQPQRLAVLQFDQLLLQIAESRPLPGQLVLPLRLRETPVVDVPGRPDALRQEHALRPVRIELEPVRLLDHPSLRTHVRSLRTRPDPHRKSAFKSALARALHPHCRDVHPRCAAARRTPSTTSTVPVTASSARRIPERRNTSPALATTTAYTLSHTSPINVSASKTHHSIRSDSLRGSRTPFSNLVQSNP